MKKILTILIFIPFVFSCSTINDPDGNTTTSVVPMPPSNLTGIVASSNQINLVWTDQSTNENGFKIERKTGSGNFAVVGTTAEDIATFNDIGLTDKTTYIYRIYSYNAVGKSLTYSSELTLSTSALVGFPTVTTATPSAISATSASVGGSITNDGGASVTIRGMVWSTNPNPTISLTTKTTEGVGTGLFTSVITGLSANTTYYIKAYATNSTGTAYGNEIVFTTLALNIPGPNVTDIDGNVYQTVTNCNQTWTKTNLNVSKYRNGDVIPQVANTTQWMNLTTGAWCYYENTTANGTTYGKLYNWYAVNDPRGLAPTGYHIPSDTEWNTLSDCLGGLSIAGGKMKETGTTHWTSPNTDATNSSGFTALPGGARWDEATFGKIGEEGYWWSATQVNTNSALIWCIISKYGIVGNGGYIKPGGFSVRCVKD